MSTLTIESSRLEELLGQLLNRDLTVTDESPSAPAAETLLGLVTDENELVAVIGCDLDFAHRSGAALAMLPSGAVPDAGSPADPELIEVYHEVANVVSRLVNEAQNRASLGRLRLDPGMDHGEGLAEIVAKNNTMFYCKAEIATYGSGFVGVWSV